MRKILIFIMSLLSVCRVVAEENMSSEMFAVSNSQEFMRLLWTETATLDDFRKYGQLVMTQKQHKERQNISYR